jgi:predicted small lipoprotein YifL
MKRLTFLLAVLASLFLFSGCGQSGPLYIPGNPSTMAVPPSNPEASEESEEEKEEEENSESSDTE